MLRSLVGSEMCIRDSSLPFEIELLLIILNGFSGLFYVPLLTFCYLSTQIIRRTQLQHGAVHLIPIGNGEQLQAAQAHLPIQIPKVSQI